MMKVSVKATHPELWTILPLWCMSHQGLCKGTDEMKSYHAGVYMQNGNIISLLLTKHTVPSVLLFPIYTGY